MTDEAMALLKAGVVAAEDRAKLARSLRQFTRMYAAHAAREDTVLFPAVRRVMTPKEYDEMGDVFEDLETKLFGEGGFEKTVEQVGGLEKTMGLDELGKFTPTA